MASRQVGGTQEGTTQEVKSHLEDGIEETVTMARDTESDESLVVGRLVEPSDELCSDAGPDTVIQDEIVLEPVSIQETAILTIENTVICPETPTFEQAASVSVADAPTFEQAASVSVGVLLSEDDVVTQVPVTNDDEEQVVETMETDEVQMKIEPVEHSGDDKMVMESSVVIHSDIKDEKNDIGEVTVEENNTFLAPQDQSPQNQLTFHNQAPKEQTPPPQEQPSSHHQELREHSPSHHQAPMDQSPMEYQIINPQVRQEQPTTHYHAQEQPSSHFKAPQHKPPSHHKAPRVQPVSNHQDLSHRLSPRSEMEARKLSLEMAPLCPPTSVIVSTQMLSMNSSIMSIPSSTPVSLLPGTVTSMPRMSVPHSSSSYPNIPTISIPEHHSSLIPQVYTSSQLIIPQPSLSQSSQIHLVTPSHEEVVKMLQPSSPTIAKAPKTDLLLQTAMKVLQLPNEDEVIHIPQKSLHISHESVLPEQTIITNGGMEQSIGVEEEVQQMEVMEVGDENTYILEPVNSNEFYDDPNIMWIQETVEVAQDESYDNLPNMVIILNPNGTVNEELMLANGMNAQDVEAVKEAVLESMPSMMAPAPVTTSPQQVVQQQQQLQFIPPPPQQIQQNLPISITSLQEPIPKKFLVGIERMMPPRTIVQSSVPLLENSRSVILDAKDDFLVLDDIARDPMIEPIDSALPVLKQAQGHPSRPVPELKRIPGNYPGGRTFHLSGSLGSVLQGNAMPLPMNELGTLDLSLPKKEVQNFKPDPAILEQYVDPSALVSENTVLRALAAKAQAGFHAIKTEYGTKTMAPPKVAKVNQKVRRQKPKDENANSPYIARKTNSLGALGNALHGSPGMKDARENAVQICPICKFQATTKNPYRHLQDHLARCHFKDRIAADLPTRKPYICPMPGCDQKSYPDWQAVMRHYIGKKHGILDKFVKEELGNIRRDDPRYKLHLRAGDLGILPRSDLGHVLPRPQDHHPQVIRSSSSDLLPQQTQQRMVQSKPQQQQQQVVQIHI